MTKIGEAEVSVEIGVDQSKLKQSLEKAKNDTKKGLGGKLIGALGPLAAVAAGFVGIKESIEAAAAGEAGISALRSSIATSGQDVEATHSKFETFAAALQESTSKFDDDAARSLLTVATNMGHVGDKAVDVSKAAAGLATYGIEAERAVNLLTLELKGNKSALQKSIPALRGVEDQQKRLQIIAEAASKGLQQQMDTTQTLSGSWGQLTASIGDLAEAFGGLITGGGGNLLQWFRDWVIYLTDSINSINEWKTEMITSFSEATTNAETWTGSFVKYFKMVTNAVNLGLQAVFFAIVNFELSWEVFKEAASNAFAYISERIKNFVRNMGTIGQFIFDNWKDIFKDIGNMVITAVTNIGKTIADLFKDVWANIKSLMSGEGFAGLKGNYGRTIFDGFESSVKNKLTLEEFAPPKMLDDAAKTFAAAFTDYMKGDTKPVADKLSNEITLGMAKAATKVSKGVSSYGIFGKATANLPGADKPAPKGGGFGSIEDVFRRVQGAALSGDSEEKKSRKQQVEYAKKSFVELTKITDAMTSGFGFKVTAVAGK